MSLVYRGYKSHGRVFLMFSTRSDTNRAVQPHKMVRGLKFRVYEVDGLYYLCSENKRVYAFAYAKRRFSHNEAHILCFGTSQFPKL